MSNTPPDLAIGHVVPISLQEEMERSYLEYAMSVIVGRALPDVRDGLKPVHRRILYAMHELGLTPDRPFRKCARVVGDVLGKYHPHGDQAVYDALVRMVQEFSSRYPLLQGHGNFGSVDDDPPAAMRYTETRLSPVSSTSLLTNIGEAIVEFAPNFDGSHQEPTVLPAQLPILLLNGADGIAVGMATKIPPHNLGELVEGLLALIDRPEIDVAGLMRHIPAPDFPTGAEIVGNRGLEDLYTKGRGSIPVRGITHIEEIQPGKGRHRRTAIVITEFPFQVNKATWLEKVADMVNQNRIDGIADLRDESDRTGIRVVIELRRDAQPDIVLNHLYRHTALQSNFGGILLALVNGEPKQLSLKAILQEFLDFRIETLTKVLQQDLDRYRSRSAELAAMLMALENLDTTIDVLRHAPDGPTAKVQLQETLGCSPDQSDTILSMPLRRITGLERDKLTQEQAEVSQKIADIEALLGDRRQFLKHLKKELRSLKKQFGNERRTRISTVETPVLEAADLIPNQAVVVQLTQKGYIRRLLPAAFERRARAQQDLQEDVDDCVVQVQATETHHDLLALTVAGRAFSIKVHEIPSSSGRSRGTPLSALLSISDDICASFALADYPEDISMVLLTRQGRIKRVPLFEFASLTARGLAALKLKDGDELGWTILSADDPTVSIVIATSAGRTLRLPLTVEQIPLMGRTAMGNQALRLRRKETVVGMAAVHANERLIFVSTKGYAKQMPARDIRLMARGNVGMQAMQFKLKSDSLAGMVVAPADATLAWMTTAARIFRLPVNSIPIDNRAGKGRRLLTTAAGESIVAVNLVSAEDS